jgi:hypothetical protein
VKVRCFSSSCLSRSSFSSNAFLDFSERTSVWKEKGSTRGGGVLARREIATGYVEVKKEVGNRSRKKIIDFKHVPISFYSKEAHETVSIPEQRLDRQLPYQDPALVRDAQTQASLFDKIMKRTERKQLINSVKTSGTVTAGL